jgi:hypothetical protein
VKVGYKTIDVREQAIAKRKGTRDARRTMAAKKKHPFQLWTPASPRTLAR